MRLSVFQNEFDVACPFDSSCVAIVTTENHTDSPDVLQQFQIVGYMDIGSSVENPNDAIVWKIQVDCMAA